MTTDELVKKAVIELEDNDIYTQYLIPIEHSPLEERDICGCWLLVFKSKELRAAWSQLYKAFRQVVASNLALKAVVTFEPVRQLDEFCLCLNRGFNEAYTTDHYDEFLNYGDCRPNDSIIRHLNELKQALEAPYAYSFESTKEQKIIDRLLHRAFVQPNLVLKWTYEPYPWTLYLPPIVKDDLSAWNKK